ncbi:MULTISPECIES: class I SAM-dependent methyltransferase [Clostridia]|uniref:class I SAM-dependent methyltransferase n=1 Tax=Clostridia TaxID=186801 RepID=UPI000EA1DEB1|nr:MULTISPECIES: class I SAM-dependent methyltransferase [Clostridia]NBJ70888.1 class I SAM-dependent methyltransferase [Roseburia sp. 1XD42-34]RKI75631.1 class I SAM-dependent methyltransferase [Clostridium sp. 1xD42-85]
MSKEFWDESFSEKEFVYGKIANAFVRSMNEVLAAGSTVACFAEGEGRNAVYLAERGHHVTAYDQSNVGLQKTTQLAQEKGVTVKTVVKDLITESVPVQQYDAAVMVFGHVPKEKQSFFIDNMFKSLKTGGYFIFEVYSEDQLAYKSGGPKDKSMLYHPVDLLNWLGGHKWVHFYYGEAERHEGKRHSGLCHVVQAVVQKTKMNG